MKKIEQVFEKHKGYCRAKELRELGIHTRDIAKAIDEGIIEKVKTGLYKLTDYPWDEYSNFTDVSKAKLRKIS